MLTDEEKSNGWNSTPWNADLKTRVFVYAELIERAIIAAYEKKLLEQEPVATLHIRGGKPHYAAHIVSLNKPPLGEIAPYLNHAPMPEVEAKYNELLMAVGRKFKGESRHATALKYIRQMEELSVIGSRTAARSEE